MGHHRLCDEPRCQGGCWDLHEDEPSPPPDHRRLAGQAYLQGVKWAREDERNRIIALLTERADATREWDGRETAVSLTYRKAIEAIQAEEK